MGLSSIIISTQKASKSLAGTLPASPLFKWIWKSHVQSGTSSFFFCYILVRDWLNTRNILRRKHFHLDYYSCVQCGLQTEETIMYLFFGCTFSIDCWALLHFSWDTCWILLIWLFKHIKLLVRGLLGFSWDPSLDSLNMYSSMSNFWFVRIYLFREISIIACWAIWYKRNNNIFFYNGVQSLSACHVFFWEKRALIGYSLSQTKFEDKLNLWLSSHLL